MYADKMKQRPNVSCEFSRNGKPILRSNEKTDTPTVERGYMEKPQRKVQGPTK